MENNNNYNPMQDSNFMNNGQNQMNNGIQNNNYNPYNQMPNNNYYSNVGPVPNQRYDGNKKINSLALVSFITSLVGLFWFAGLICGIIAIVSGIVGLARFDEKTESCKWMGIVGIIIGVVDVFILTLSIKIDIATIF